MDILMIIKEASLGSFFSVINIAKIVIPLMIIMEFGRNYRVIDKISGYFEPFTNKIGMTSKASFPLLVGLIFGISYGSGVLIQSASEGDLTEKDQILLVTFLIMCHAVFEDTLLFVAIGAKGMMILIPRIIIAFILVLIVSKRILNEDENSRIRLNKFR
ncbi:nucleoside recognition domain-containing protein [Helicovermis profundi]|uniref:Nucleoside recognition domain-containing protein n=1 Tax=Helicovermis profundi TaxID=3065157 RepID=A0AAU9EPD4_9FIRM|nr:nucleoside recognition domain-containing protein [Clostridia bacterium S502]